LGHEEEREFWIYFVKIQIESMLFFVIINAIQQYRTSKLILSWKYWNNQVYTKDELQVNSLELKNSFQSCIQL
jgi:hypothetical protein